MLAMKIQACNNNPQFGIKYSTREYPHSDKKRWLITNIDLDNGKSLDIYRAFKNNELYQKLYYLSDSAGKWIKSKLKVFTNGKLIKILRSENGYR